MDPLQRNLQLLSEKITFDLLQKDFNYMGLPYIEVKNPNNNDIYGIINVSKEQTIERIPNFEKFILRGNEAVKNEFYMWVFSKKGDYWRDINKGGFFEDVHIKYPLTENNINSLKEDLIKALKRDLPNLNFLKIDVDINYEKKAWVISAFFEDKKTGLGVNIEETEIQSSELFQ